MNFLKIGPVIKGPALKRVGGTRLPKLLIMVVTRVKFGLRIIIFPGLSLPIYFQSGAWPLGQTAVSSVMLPQELCKSVQMVR